MISSRVNSTDKMQVGFNTLRGLVNQRPSIREDALHVLLELSSHPEKRIRGAAINTLKIWVPHTQPMDSLIRHFAVQMLKKLQAPSSKKVTTTEGEMAPQTDETADKEVSPAEDVTAANGGTTTPVPEKVSTDEPMDQDQESPEELLQTPYLPDRIELPAQKDQVLQHLELMFALCVKVPDFLER